MMAIDLRMLTADQLAELIGVTVKTLHEWRKSGKGPAFYSIGKAGPGGSFVRYAECDVKAWLEQWRVAAPEKAAPEIPPIRRYRKSKKLKVES